MVGSPTWLITGTSQAKQRKNEMVKLNVPEMTCGHCASIVTKALQSVDPQAQIDIDLASKSVAVTSSADTSALEAALVEAGYPGTPA